MVRGEMGEGWMVICTLETLYSKFAQQYCKLQHCCNHIVYILAKTSYEDTLKKQNLTLS